MSDRSPAARHEQAAAIFAAALECAHQERTAFLDAACADSPDLRVEVASLLIEHETGSGLLDTPDPAWLASLIEEPDTMPVPGDRVGPYRILRELGHGGMGTVFLAERADGQFEKHVALKVVRDGLFAPAFGRRFLRERSILARLEHPGIAHLLDGGMTERGRPFLVLEYVEGEPITKYCDTRHLDINARLALFESVCAAVHYAHRNLIVHRDLKPANILVSGMGVKLLDFGIAKLLGDGVEEDAALTVGPLLMTPEYAAPEQLRGEPVTTATDVHALGAVLYELLVGRCPHDVKRGSIAELARVLSEDVAPPSVVLSRTSSAESPTRPSVMDVAAARGLTPARLRQRLSGDLDAIALTALHPAPDQRYASAEALGEDVRRHRLGFPVRAHPVTPLHRLARFARRNPLAATASTIAVLSLAVGLTGTAWQAREAARERDAALHEAEKANSVYSLTARLFQLANPEQARGRDITLREVLDTGRVFIARELANQPELRADMDIVLGDVYYSLGLFQPALELFNEAVEARASVFGEEYESVATALLMAGKAHEALDHADSAEFVARRGLGILERLPPFEGQTFSVTHALVRLAESLRRQGRFAAAEDTIRYALAVLPVTDADTEHRRTVLLTLLGHVLRARGDLRGAEAAYRETLDVRRRLRGPEDPEVANAVINVANVLADQNRLAEAESLFRDGLAMRGKLQGEDHAEYAIDLAAFADLLRRASRPAEALSAYEETLTRLRVLVPGDHPIVVRSMIGHAATLLDLGRNTEADRQLRHATAAADSLLARLGDQTPEVRSIRQLLEGVRARR